MHQRARKLMALVSEHQNALEALQWCANKQDYERVNGRILKIRQTLGKKLDVLCRQAERGVKAGEKLQELAKKQRVQPENLR